MPFGRNPLAREPLGGDGHRRGEVEHVDGAASPHLAVDQLAAEGIVAPAVGVHRHDVGVPHQEQRGRGRVAALDARDEARASGRGFEALAVEPVAFEVGLQQIRAAHLVTRRFGAVVHARVADEVLQQIGHLVGHASDTTRAFELFMSADLLQHPPVHSRTSG